jgi:hypothetical protein
MGATRVDEAGGRRRVAAAEDAGVDARADGGVEVVSAEAGPVVCAREVFYAGYKLATSASNRGSLRGRLTVTDALYLITAGPDYQVLSCRGAGVASRTGQRVGSISTDVAACCDAASEEGVFDLSRLCDDRVGRG